MAAGTEFSPAFAMLEGGFNVSVGEDEISQNSDHLKQMAIRKPPRHLSVVRQSMSTATLLQPMNTEFGVGIVAAKSGSDGKSEFLPIIRSGSCAEKGPKQYMEDEHICIDNLLEYLDGTEGFPPPGAFYGVFDGHGGTDAASYVRKNILKFIVEDSQFPVCLEKAIHNAFVKADHAFAENSSLDISSGTTALTALIFGRFELWRQSRCYKCKEYNVQRLLSVRERLIRWT